MAFPKEVSNQVIEYSKDIFIFGPAGKRKNEAIRNYVDKYHSELTLSGKATCISFLIGSVRELNTNGLIGLSMGAIAKVSYFKGRAGMYRYFTDLKDVLASLVLALNEGVDQKVVLKTDLTQEEQFLIKYINKD